MRDKGGTTVNTRATVTLGIAAAIVVGVIGLAVRENQQGADQTEALLAEPVDDTQIVCEIDLDDHPTRDEVIAVLGEPVDVDHDEGSDNLDGSEWLPAIDTLTWSNGDTVSFDTDTDRADSWSVADPRVC